MIRSMIIEYDDVLMLNRRIQKLEMEGWQVQSVSTLSHDMYLKPIMTVWLTRWEDK